MNRRSVIGAGVSGLSLVTGIGTGLAANGTGASGSTGQPKPPATIKHGERLKQLDIVLPLLRKEATLKYLDAAEMSKSERGHLKDNLKELWREIDIAEQKKRNGSLFSSSKTTTYELQGSIEDANQTIRTLRARGRGRTNSVSSSTATGTDVLSAINAGARKLAFQDGTDSSPESKSDVSAQWWTGEEYETGNSHHIINYYAGMNLGLEPWHCDNLKSHGGDPDHWENYDIDPVSEFHEILYEYIKDKAPKDPARMWAHAYSPTDFAIYDPRDPLSLADAIKWGSADEFAHDHMEKAHDADANNNKERQYRKMGHALHFLTDVGNPMHTGGLGKQFNHNWIHKAYEMSVEYHLYFPDQYSGDKTNVFFNNVNFEKHPNLDANSYEEVPGNRNWAKHTRQLASETIDYADQHAEMTYEYGVNEDSDIIEAAQSENGNNPPLEQQMEWCMKETVRYAMGFVEEYNADVDY
jgi:hypothetical protein